MRTDPVLIVGAGAGVYQAAFVTLTPGTFLPPEDRTPEGIAAHWAQIIDRTGEITPQSGSEQSQSIVAQLGRMGALG